MHLKKENNSTKSIKKVQKIKKPSNIGKVNEHAIHRKKR